MLLALVPFLCKQLLPRRHSVEDLEESAGGSGGGSGPDRGNLSWREPGMDVGTGPGREGSASGIAMASGHSVFLLLAASRAMFPTFWFPFCLSASHVLR